MLISWFWSLYVVTSYKKLFVFRKCTQNYLQVTGHVCILLLHSSEKDKEVREQSKCNKTLTCEKSGRRIYKNSSYYFCNFAVSLKLWPNKRKIKMNCSASRREKQGTDLKDKTGSEEGNCGLLLLRSHPWLLWSLLSSLWKQAFRRG